MNENVLINDRYVKKASYGLQVLLFPVFLVRWLADRTVAKYLPDESEATTRPEGGNQAHRSGILMRPLNPKPAFSRFRPVLAPARAHSHR